ncbi:threonine--tRNA ligase [Patescibacteria group bacterium]|nr:threonine--tRNA ligase [Patescibacteria group bacterium]MBU1705903.1 threonine--tRNA ligase [Patescibacteria group bacterium]
MDEEQLKIMRHSCAHILAAAVTELYPGVKLGVGPVVDQGFYYDVLTPTPVTEEDLVKIEEKMHEIIAKATTFDREEIGLDQAIDFFRERHQDFKVELLKDLKEKGTTKISVEELADVGDRPDTASLYRTGEFVDLCRGPHVQHAGQIGVFKLTKLAGAYWRGRDGNPQMQRIYGVAFETEQQLEEYLVMLEEAKRRDHRKLGKEMGLYTFSELVGAGLPLWTPKGTLLRNILDDFVWQMRREYGYQKVTIPHITKKDLYETSGHWEKFKDDLFRITTREGHEFVMKPMNCPHHTQIFDCEKRSYRDLPQRYAETTMVYRDEQTGELSGLTRVRSITQDDAHVFCRETQVKEEAYKIWDIIERFYAAFGFELEVRLSTHDPANMKPYLGTVEQWDGYVAELKSWLEEKGLPYRMGLGEAAFYGPKLDFMAHDSLGREWQVATIQVDRNMPERFGLHCVNEHSEDERIVMIHAAIMGSIERFLAVLIEHTAGAFPAWLAPVQVRIATVSQDFVPFAEQLGTELVAAGLRAELDDSDEKVGKKIRAAAMAKVPWTIVIGSKEAEGGDFKINVFGQDEDLVVARDQLIATLLEATQRPS